MRVIKSFYFNRALIKIQPEPDIWNGHGTLQNALRPRKHSRHDCAAATRISLSSIEPQTMRNRTETDEGSRVHRLRLKPNCMTLSWSHQWNGLGRRMCGIMRSASLPPSRKVNTVNVMVFSPSRFRSLSQPFLFFYPFLSLGGGRRHLQRSWWLPKHLIRRRTTTAAAPGPSPPAMCGPSFGASSAGRRRLATAVVSTVLLRRRNEEGTQQPSCNPVRPLVMRLCERELAEASPPVRQLFLADCFLMDRGRKKTGLLEMDNEMPICSFQLGGFLSFFHTAGGRWRPLFLCSVDKKNIDSWHAINRQR